MNSLNINQQQLLLDYAQFIRGQNSKKVHLILRICGGFAIVGSLIFTSILGIALGIFLLGVSFLGNQQHKFVEAALDAARQPSHIQTVQVEIQTKLWENNTYFYADITDGNNLQYRIEFVPLKESPRIGKQLATAYYRHNARIPSLITIDDVIIIPSTTPKAIKKAPH